MKHIMYNIGHKKNHATTSAASGVCSSVGSFVICCALLGGMAAAYAGPGESGEHGQRKEEIHAQREAVRADRQAERQAERQAGPGGMQQQRPPEARQLDPRSFEARAEEQRRAMQDASRNAETGRRMRLTADERRDLRRQINEAGQDIYANPPRH